MDWRVNGDDGRPSLCKPVVGDSTTVRRSVIHDPKYPLRRFVRFLAHDLINQPLKRLDSGLSFTSAEDSCSMDVPSSKICQSALSLIFVFNTHFGTGFGRERFGHSSSRLDAGLLVSRNYIIVRSQRHSHPHALIQVQDRPRFAGKFGITRKNPAPILPRLDGIFTQPSPDGDPTDAGNNSGFQNMPFNFFAAKTRQRYTQFRGKLTSQGFNFHHDSGGKTEQGARVWIDRTIQPGAFQKTVCATCLRSAVAQAGWQFHHWRVPGRPEALFWRASQKNTAPYISVPLLQVLTSRPETTQSSTGFSVAYPPSLGREVCHHRKNYAINTSSYL